MISRVQEPDPGRTIVFHPNARLVVHFGEFCFDLVDGVLSRGGQEVRVPPRALTILRHLVERAGRVVSKQALMDAAWKNAYVSETSLTEAIGLVRQALGDDPQHPVYIQTVHRRGYRFIAPISTELPDTQPRLQDRARDIVTASPAIDVTVPPPSARPPGALRASRGRLALLIACALLLIGGVAWLALKQASAPPVVRVSLTLSPDQAPAPGLNAHPVVTISPDGRRIVYVAGVAGATRLFVREMDRFDATALAGTHDAHGPFFSPDGRWVGFFAEGRMKKIRLDGSSEPQVLCATPTGVGGTWLSDDQIVFAPDWIGPLLRVPASGGRPEVAANRICGRATSIERR